MSRYLYAIFFALMTGGVTAGIVGVLVGELSSEAGWAPALSGVCGTALALLVYVAVLRASSEERR